MGKALYRKYRPTKLSDVVGQESVTNALQNALDTDKISHAYLFTGPRGTGKTSIARIFAHAVNKFDYQLEDDYVDIVEIDAASNRGIDNIRELREKAVIAPTKGRFKVYIMDEVHMLTKEANNALLKLFEEPPAHVIFIMATTDAHKVPITISSRAQTFIFKLASPETMFQHLRFIADQEKIPIDDAALKLVVRRGGGSFRDSISLLDQVSTLSQGRITEQTVIDALGLPQDQKIVELLNSFKSGDLSQISAIIKGLLSSGSKPETIAEVIIRQIFENPEPALLPLLESLPKVQAPFAEAKLLIAFTSNLTTHQNFVRQPSVVHTPHSSTTKPTATKLSQSTVSDNVSPKVTSSVPNTTPPSIGATPTSPTAFSWENFLKTIKATSRPIAGQLEKVDYDFKNNTLHIYPQKKITKSLLESTNNRALLQSQLGGIALIIHDIEDTKNPAFSKISDIMGTVEEVNTSGGEIPF